MKKQYLFLFIFLFGLGNLTAQSFVGTLNQNPTQIIKKYDSNDTLKILAIMVEFQKDIDDATFGNGKFGSIYSKDYGHNILDPLPHDKAHFENHLKFVQNYYKKVSNGKLNISYRVLDDIVTVSKTMRNYTPPLDELSNHAPLGEFVNEVWQLADIQFSNVNFSEYDLFFIFHAGVGKDVVLPGSLGNERDLPSVFFNLKSLQNIFGPDFIGFPINNGNFNIKNSAILPTTESRELSGFSGTTLIELTINGLIAATVGSYLGLPDLFNTETGRSAIGRFGLMDGQSIFTYQGIFPPEPSAWEKMFLGWVTPTEISIDDVRVTLTNKYVANMGDTTLIKIPINATEYYLIENRKRDALNDGASVTYISNGITYTETFDRDYSNFIYYNVDTLKGVIIDVDEFDWALPGGDRNSKIEKFEDLGLIIWHIDEKIIADNYKNNKINNDRFKRGVAVVEADGIRDIGEEFKTIFGETVIGEGTKEDTWYKNNPAEYFENKFSANTKPKAESNSSANSLITLSEFSEISNKMSFNISFGSDDIELIANTSLPFGREPILWLSGVKSGDRAFIVASNSEKIYSLEKDGNIVSELSFENAFKPAIYPENQGVYAVSVSSTKLHFSKIIPNIVVIDSVEIATKFTTSPIIYSTEGDSVKFLIGTYDGKINKYSIDINGNRKLHLLESNQIFAKAVNNIAVSGSDYVAYSREEFWSSEFPSSTIQLDETPTQLLLSRNSDNRLSAVLLFMSNFATVVGEDITIHNSFNNQLSKVDDTQRVTLNDKIILADIKKDGDNYIIKKDGNHLSAYNLSGFMASNFPIMEEFENDFHLSPLAVDLNNDEAADIIAFTKNGKIIAVDGLTGKMINGFPITSGSGIRATPIIFTEDGKTGLAILTKDNQFLSWNISQDYGKQFWTEMNGNANNSSSVAAAGSNEIIAEFFPQSKAYNWPNPVYDGITNIRYFVSEDSRAEVTIFDLAGDLVAKLSGNGIGGFDNEIIWNVDDIQSGVYFAHLQVTSNSGKTDTKIIKIAVIK